MSSRLLIKAFLVAALRSDFRYPFLSPRAKRGGKVDRVRTSLLALIASRTSTLSDIPRGSRTDCTARNSWLVCFGNLSRL